MASIIDTDREIVRLLKLASQDHADPHLSIF